MSSTNGPALDAGEPPAAGIATTDYAASAFLIAKGHELTTARWAAHECVFFFGADAAGDLDAFYQGGLVAGLAYFKQLRFVRNIIEQERRRVSREVVTSHGVMRVEPRRR
jgi:hypothetical protein